MVLSKERLAEMGHPKLLDEQLKGTLPEATTDHIEVINYLKEKAKKEK